MLGSVMTLYKIWEHRKQPEKAGKLYSYHYIMMLMAVCDFLSSASYALSTWPILRTTSVHTSPTPSLWRGRECRDLFGARIWHPIWHHCYLLQAPPDPPLRRRCLLPLYGTTDPRLHSPRVCCRLNNGTRSEPPLSLSGRL